MPCYPIACPCGFHGDVFARVKDLVWYNDAGRRR